MRRAIGLGERPGRRLSCAMATSNRSKPSRGRVTKGRPPARPRVTTIRLDEVVQKGLQVLEAHSGVKRPLNKWVNMALRRSSTGRLPPSKTSSIRHCEASRPTAKPIRGTSKPSRPSSMPRSPSPPRIRWRAAESPGRPCGFDSSPNASWLIGTPTARNSEPTWRRARGYCPMGRPARQDHRRHHQAVTPANDGRLGRPGLE